MRRFDQPETARAIGVLAITRNGFVWLALALCSLLLVAALHVPVLSDVLQVAPPGRSGWLLIGAMAAMPWLAGQAWLVWIRSTSARRAA